MKKKTKEKQKLSVIIPVYNEKNLIIEVLKKVRDIKIDNTDIEIIIIDDCSNDGTTEIIRKQAGKWADKIIYHKVNQGKGASLKSGFQVATGDVIVIQDADFEYDPHEIPYLVQPIFEQKAKVVYGSRFLAKNTSGYKANLIANKVLTLLSNLMTGLKLTDMETCYKAFRAEIIKNIDIQEKRFGFEPEITAKISKLNIEILEIPIHYYPRNKEAGKKIKIKDGFRALYCIAKYRFTKKSQK